MKTKYKIIVIAGLSPLVIIGGLVLGPALYMIAAIQYSGFIISSTPDKVFEEKFAEIPEVKVFIEKYPNYTTSHLQDIIGWKIIMYKSEIVDGKSVNLHVKKSVLHQGIGINAGCDQGGSSFTFEISHEQVIDYLKNERCMRK